MNFGIPVGAQVPELRDGEGLLVVAGLPGSDAVDFVEQLSLGLVW